MCLSNNCTLGNQGEGGKREEWWEEWGERERRGEEESEKRERKGVKKGRGRV